MGARPARDLRAWRLPGARAGPAALLPRKPPLPQTDATDVEPAGPPAERGLYGPNLARIHHRHFGMVAEAAAEELLSRLAARGVRAGTIADLAAGSGILSQRATVAGFDAWGVDIAPDMIDLAREHAPAARFELGSLWTAALPACVAAAAVGEAFCYQTGDGDIEAAALAGRLAEIHAALVPGGLLLFDVAGPGRAGPAPAQPRFWDLGEAFVGVQVSEDGQRRRLTRTIDSFLPAGDLYRHHRETHVLTLHRPDEVEAALTRAGFAVERLDGYAQFRFPPGWHGFAATRAG